MTFSLFDRARKNKPLPRTEPGQRIYAIGDIHGRIDLHAALMAKIVADAAAIKGRDLILIYLGDYIDRGPESKQMIEILSAGPPEGFTAHYLRGNHEDMMLQFIDGINVSKLWFGNGGRETLYAYDCDEIMDLEKARNDLQAALPAAHLDFLRSLKIRHQEGDYLFVHAGLKPGIPIELQSDMDVIWIRTAFLKSKKDFGKFVIHGHSIQPEPEIRDNRIGIDTGAWHTGVLSCLVLDGEEKKFIST